MSWHRFLLAIALSTVTHAAYPCTCLDPGSGATLLTAPAVFAGKLASVDYLDSKESAPEPRILATFAVTEVWRGPVNRTIVVRTTLNRFTCAGYPFTQGAEYLVVAGRILDVGNGRSPEVGDIHLCGGTKLLVNAQSDIQAFGPGKKPGP